MSSRLERIHRPRLTIPKSNALNKIDALGKAPLPSGGLTPDLQPSTPTETVDGIEERLSQVEHYIIGSRLGDSTNVFSAHDLRNQQEAKCKIFPISNYRSKLAPYYRLDGHPNIIPIKEVLLGEKFAYVFFEKDHGDLHSYVRSKKKLAETEAKELFRQIAHVVKYCHDCGIVINQLKLRKFVFRDAGRTQLMLDCNLEDARILEDPSADDTIYEKHGCPAYISPEILDVVSGGLGYSGRAADVWSMGVILYTLLLGRYPFQDLEPTRLFTKIRQGRCTVPSYLSPLARCLIKTMLRPEADQRLDSTEVLTHPWFRVSNVSPYNCETSTVSTTSSTSASNTSTSHRSSSMSTCARQQQLCNDQLVPDDKHNKFLHSNLSKKKLESALVSFDAY